MEPGTTWSRRKGQNEAVSEIKGTLILITIAVTLLSALTMIILNP